MGKSANLSRKVMRWFPVTASNFIFYTLHLKNNQRVFIDFFFFINFYIIISTSASSTHIWAQKNSKGRYRWFFWRMEENHSPISYQKIWRTTGLKTGALLVVISDIHRVLWVSSDTDDVSQGTHPPAVCFSNFLMWIWGVISFQSPKISLVIL